MPKHIARRDVRKIGNERVNILVNLAREAVREGKDERARRYVGIARAICGKAQTEMPKDFGYCRKCLLPTMPGINCTVRLTSGKVVTGCKCGCIRRVPYLREQKS